MSLELGRSSAARDDDDAAEESGASQSPDEGTADGAPRRSVLAPFMIGDSIDDSLPEESSDEPGEASDDTASDTGHDQPPEPVDASSPAVSAAASEPDSAPDASTTAPANAGLSDAKAPAAGVADPAAGDEDDTAAAPPDDAATATAPGPAYDGTAATPDADDTTGSDVPRQGVADDWSAPGASGAGSPLADAAGPAAAATSSVPAPRTGATGPRLDSGGLGKAVADVDEPLLEDADELRANWLRLQAGFVDNPHEAVSDAADLVEHTAQALVGALRKRQQELRQMWHGGRPNGSGTTDADEDGQGARLSAADTTEQLRLLMKRYRVLFNHICKS
jgi:hypothetical protein